MKAMRLKAVALTEHPADPGTMTRAIVRALPPTAWLRSRTACPARLLPLLSLFMLPSAVQAQFNYTTNDGAVTITGYTGPGDAVTIPSTIAGLPVVRIGNHAFEFTSLTNVTIPDSVTSIGYWAFGGCTSLSNLTVPNSVTNIGDNAFGGCTRLTAITVAALNPVYTSSVGGVLFNKNQTTLIQYPGGKTGSYAVTNSVTSIGSGAFSGCTSLTSVTIPNSVTNIGDSAFYGCTSLPAITVAALNLFYSSGVDGVLFNQSRTTLIQYPGGRVGSYTVPNTATSIGSGAFSGCHKLTSVTIPTSVTSIEYWAFGGCTGLTNVTIPTSVTNLGDNAFGDCTSLTAITVAALNPVFTSSVDGVLFDQSRTTLIQCPGGKAGSYTVPNSVTNIGIFAFLGCNSLTSLTLPETITSIGDGAFSHCNSLTSLTIPDTVSTIGDWVFQYCTSLTSVTLPANVTSIGDWAFSGCDSLTSVTIPNSVTNLGSHAYSYCNSLTGIHFQGNAPGVDSSAFTGANNTIVYYLPGTTGWGVLFGGRPTALWQPQLLVSPASVGVRTNRFGFDITGTSGLIVVVEACTNLANPVWFPAGTHTLTGGSAYFSDSEWANHPRRFYRLRSP